MKIPMRLTLPPAKRFLPTRLFMRTLLILLVPLVVLQLSVAYVFYARHWQSIKRNMAAVTASDIVLLTREYERVAHESNREAALAHTATLGRALSIDVRFDSDIKPIARGRGYREFPELYESLSGRLDHPFMVRFLDRDDDSKIVEARVAVANGALDFTIGAKRLVSSTTSIFLVWMVGSSTLLMIIATMLLRNQIRPVVQLARAAEQFGLGREVEGFSPKGASEIRRAASAFLLMADRIRRAVASRTEMLAGISHDLRTPLTRMKLELEMGKVDEKTRTALATDIDEMRHMIDEYLDFARGDAGEPMEPYDITLLLKELAESYQRQGAPVRVGECAAMLLMMRPKALRRALQNVIENALRYGKEANIALEQSLAFVRIKVTDKGPGIPEPEFETVFKPFTRLDPSRNVTTGGVGLGLSIARDIVQGHGGEITLENQHDKKGAITGLEVTIRLPREVNR